MNADKGHTAGLTDITARPDLGEELLPCPNPWCEVLHDPDVTQVKGGKWVSWCDCGVKTPRFDTEAEARQAWNQRTRPDARPDLGEPVAWLCRLGEHSEVELANPFCRPISPDDEAAGWTATALYPRPDALAGKLAEALGECRSALISARNYVLAVCGTKNQEREEAIALADKRLAEWEAGRGE